MTATQTTILRAVWHPDGWTAQQAQLRAFDPVLAWIVKTGSTRRTLLGMAVYSRGQGDRRKFAAKALASVRSSRPPIAAPVFHDDLWQRFWEQCSRHAGGG